MQCPVLQRRQRDEVEKLRHHAVFLVHASDTLGTGSEGVNARKKSQDQAHGGAIPSVIRSTRVYRYCMWERVWAVSTVGVAGAI